MAGVVDYPLTAASQSSTSVECEAGAVFIRGTITTGKLYLDVNPPGAAVNYVDSSFQAADLPNADDDSAKCAIEPFDADVLSNVKFRTSSNFVGSVYVSIVPKPAEPR